MPKKAPEHMSKGEAKASPKPSVERSCATCAYAIAYNQVPWLDCNIDLPPVIAQTGKTKVHASYKCIFHKHKD